MSSASSISTRVVVTGYCAAHERHRADSYRWLEYSSSQPLDLRAQLDQSAKNSTMFEKSGNGWWERFFSCGIIGELISSKLWQRNRLTIDPLRVGVCFSSSKGRPADWETKSGNFENSVFSGSVFGGTCDWALCEILRMTRAQGKRACPVAACASGAHAIALGAQWIEDGQCDVVICGAIEAELAPLVLAGYRSLGALSASHVMRPFDTARDGFVPATGGACLVLESEKSAKQRGIEVLGAVSGWSFFGDTTSLTGLEASGIPIAHAIENALQRANVRRQDDYMVKYVNAHGTATRMNDEIEARAIEQTLGVEVPVSSTKSLTGHTLGAAGAIEAVLCLLSMHQSFALPNLNLQACDKTCAINVLKTGQEMEIETALSLSYGFGGHIGVLLLERN